jgi:outer membrane receptor for ferrienterochelin and colicin
MSKIWIIITLMCFNIRVRAQQVIVSGYLTDDDQEAIAGAVTFDIQHRKPAYTNTYGFFSLTLSAGRTCISFHAAGYQPDTLCRDFRRDTLLKIRLKGQELATVNVISSPSYQHENPSAVVLPMEIVKKMPGLGGEADPMRALAFTPGVTNGSEGSAGLFVRGGTPDQNLILLDGAVVYNPNHLFGFLSVFNPDALKNMELIKGGFPARYGGRLSSVLDVSMREGNMERIKGSAGIGLVTSKAMVEGPWRKDRGSFMVSGRCAYLGLLLLPARLAYNSSPQGNYTGYNMYDLNGKINYRLSERQHLYLSLYSSRDRLNVLDKQPSEKTQTTLAWGNITGSLRYTHALNGRLFWKSMLLFSDFDYLFGGAATTTVFEKSSTELRQTSGLNEVTFRNELEWAAGQRHFWRFGAEYTTYRFNPFRIALTSQTPDTLITQGTGVNLSAQSYTLYAENTWQITTRLKANIGGRFNGFYVQEKQYSAFNPRVSLSYQLNSRLSAVASYVEANQNIHLLTNSSMGLQNDIWVPATPNIRPQYARQYAAGFNYLIPALKARITLEGYHKTMTHQIEYREGFNTLNAFESNWEDLVTTNGEGRSYGFELGIAKHYGRLTGLAAYTWSSTTRQFANINGGRPFPFKYDYRHNANLTANWSLSDKWDVSGSAVFHTGQAISVPELALAGPPGSISDANRLYFYRLRNNARLPAYARIDIGFNRTKKLEGGRESIWNFSIYNVLNRKNILYAQLANQTFFDPEQRRMRSRPTIVLQPFLPILPAVHYSRTF